MYLQHSKLLRGGQLPFAGTEQMEWHLETNVFDVFDTIPLILLQSLPQARSAQLRCHQPPVIYSSIVNSW